MMFRILIAASVAIALAMPVSATTTGECPPVGQDAAIIVSQLSTSTAFPINEGSPVVIDVAARNDTYSTEQLCIRIFLYRDGGIFDREVDVGCFEVVPGHGIWRSTVLDGLPVGMYHWDVKVIGEGGCILEGVGGGWFRIEAPQCLGFECPDCNCPVVTGDQFCSFTCLPYRGLDKRGLTAFCRQFRGQEKWICRRQARECMIMCTFLGGKG